MVILSRAFFIFFTFCQALEEFISVLEQIWIKDSYLDQRLLQHESLYPIGLKSARIEILHGGNSFT